MVSASLGHGSTQCLSLPQLQNNMKRTPQVYSTEFLQQMSSFEAQLAIYELSPTKDSKEFGKLVTFLSHVSYLYPERSTNFSTNVLGLFKKRHAEMIPPLRHTLFNALVLLKNKRQLDQVVLLEFCFELFDCQDKLLRQSVFSFIIEDVKKANQISNQVRLNKAVLNMVLNVLKNETNASLKGLQVLIELYKKRVLVGSRCVNVIVQALYLQSTKLVRLALSFFLGIDEQIESLEAEEEEQRNDQVMQKAGGTVGDNAEALSKRKAVKRTHSKKTRSRIRLETKQKKLLIKYKQQTNPLSAARRRIATARFAAIELINDPQTVSEALFQRLTKGVDVFEMRLNIMNLVSRIIGLNKLMLFQFYSFIRRYLQPHQRQVTLILSYLIQALHELVPPEIIQAEVKLIANNFINDRTDAETMAVGLNSVREIVSRVPLLTDVDGFDDLMADLIQYRTYRRSKSVVMAARGLLNLVREINPSSLSTKERGRDHEIENKPLEYGIVKVATAVAGAELLQQPGQHDEEEGSETAAVSAAPVPIDQQRILSAADFSRIKRKQARAAEEKGNEKRLKKQGEKQSKLQFKHALLRQLEGAGEALEEDTDSGSEEHELDDSALATSDAEQSSVDEFTDSSLSEDEENTLQTNLGIVNPNDLEGHVRRKRRDLADRLEAVYEGRQEARKFSSKSTRSAGTSNAEKKKGKNFLMIKHSNQVKRKQSQSLRQQQHHLKRHIKNLERNKKTVQRIHRKSRK